MVLFHASKVQYMQPGDNLLVHYCDANLLVLEKPSGLLSVPGRGPDLQDCLSSRIQTRFPTAVVVHRLDRDTSGLMVMALDKASQRNISLQFEKRHVQKVYECIVQGTPSEYSGCITLPIGRDLTRPPRYKIDHENGRFSETSWTVLENHNCNARLLIKPLTGRSHQIRLHLASVDHPILGDPLYADATALAAADRLLLHAREIQLSHPTTGETMCWQSACPF